MDCTIQSSLVNTVWLNFLENASLKYVFKIRMGENSFERKSHCQHLEEIKAIYIKSKDGL